MLTRATPARRPYRPCNNTASDWKPVKHPIAKRGFMLLPSRWVIERSFAWAARFRRLARDYERLLNTLKGIYFIAFAVLMTAKFIKLASS